MTSTLLSDYNVAYSDSDFYNNNNLTLLQLEFTQEELATCAESRKVRPNKASLPWINKAADIFWNETHSAINI